MSALELPHQPVEKIALENGLTLILREDGSSPVVSMQGWCQTGSIHEGVWTGAGLSHILEHMLFKGTRARGATEVAAEVAGLGGQINAYTSFDRTVYYIDAPAESCGGCLDVLMDVVARATIPADEFEREQEVIRREFAMVGDDPDRVASREMFATAFRTHPYGVPVIGYRSIFDALTRADVLDYYRARYAPGNLFFVVVGNIDAGEVRRQIEDFFAELPRRAIAPVMVPAEPEQLGRRDTLKLFPTPVTKLWMAWKIPAVTHPDMPALDVLATVLGDGRSSRLHTEVRERQAAVHQIGAYAYTPSDAGLFAIGADLDPSKRRPAESAILDELARLVGGGVSEDELHKARNIALANQFSTMASMRGQAADLGSNWLLTGNLDFTRHYLRQLAEVDVERVSEVAARYLVERTLSVVELAAEHGDVSPAAVVSSGRGDRVVQHTLGNGLELVVQHDRRLPVVSLCAAFRGGLLAESERDSGITGLVASSLLQGSGRRSADELAAAMESLGGSADAGSGNNSFFVNGGALAPDAAIAFEVIAEVLTDPAFPKDAVAREREAQLADIDEERQRPTGVAFNAAKRALFSDHPYAMSRLGQQESVAGLTVDDLRNFHRGYAVAANGVLSVCGDIEPALAIDLAERYFASLPAGEQAFADAGDPLWPDVAQERVQHLDKEQAVVVVAVPGADLASPDRPALDLLEQACSGMDGRLFLRIREERGLAYFTGATQLVGLARGGLLFYAGTRPDAADDVMAEMLDELKHIAQHGLDDSEIERAKRVYAGRHCIDKQSHRSRAQGAALDVLYGLGFGHDELHLERLGALDRRAIADVAERYLAPGGKVCIKVLP